MRRDAPHDFVFYSPQLDSDATNVTLVDEEHHHLSHVLRTGVGDTVYVSNGRGMIVRCVVASVAKTTSALRVEDTVRDATGNQPLILALACLKKEAYEVAVKQCTELGVTHFVPFASVKAHIKEYSEAFLDRLRRIALAAMKQSFRATLPTIDPPISYRDLIARAESCPSVVVGDADAQPLGMRDRARPLMMVVGPESGLASAERERLEAVGCEFGSVSAHRLRSETAAAALTSLMIRSQEGR